MTRKTGYALLALLLAAPCGCGEAPDPSGWELVRVFEVEGRQGVATDGDRYYVSGSTALFVYTQAGEQVRANRDPFEGLARKANHIGDISVHDGQLFAGIEWFMDGVGTNIQVAVYDAETLRYERSIDWSPDSGQAEVSAVAVDADRGAIWMTDWTNGSHVYRYDLASGAYAGKLRLEPAPKWQQGLAVLDGQLYITADDGDAEHDEPDSLWRARAESEADTTHVTHVMSFESFRRAGEIEGIDFDPRSGEMIVLSNRGKRIVLGMPKGLYPGYEREIHEVYVFRNRRGD